MEIMKCRMCGGNVSIDYEHKIAVCDYCGSTLSLNQSSSDRQENLRERADQLHRQGEFDKALATYEILLNENPRDALACWGALLSTYGIEYVNDPHSHNLVPTCHRTQFLSILSHPYYKNALDYAESETHRKEFEDQGKLISEVQKGILEISRQEPPYDVFICYKEQSETGTRTKDSVLAQDIHYHLQREGFRVFFSRITLEEKIGRAYEPYIFAALTSAKVMVVIGTKPDYFNAVWVRNEWGRFLNLMKKEHSKLLIPCYKDMNPYDLPEELTVFQSLDMSKIGFLQDLVGGIKKIISTAEESKPMSQPEHKAPKLTEDQPLDIQAALGIVENLLAHHKFTNAEKALKVIINQDPMCARAYFYQFLIDNQCTDITTLRNEAQADWFQQENFAKALVLARGRESEEFKSYIVLNSSDDTDTSSDNLSNQTEPESYADKTIFQYYAQVFRKYFTFSGRARRKEYWGWWLIHLVITLLLMWIDNLVFHSTLYWDGPLAITYGIVSFFPGLAVMTRRLHDRGHSFWFILINFIPFIGTFVFFIVLCLDSHQNDNQYGPSPKYS